jgi:hypothetical protein
MSGEKMSGEHPDYAFTKMVDEIIDTALETEKFSYKSGF